MGVPSFYRWLSRKYPKIVLDVVEEKSPEVAGVRAPVDTSRPNPNGFEIDNLYLDMNGIIHPCCHPEDGEAPDDEDEMCQRVFLYIDRIFAMVRPRKVLYMAIDGVAPRAKMNQQRSRRFRSAKEVTDKEIAEEELRQEWIDKGMQPPAKKPRPWDSNVITPGTPFMAKLSRALHWYITDRLTHTKGWQGCKVVFSDAKVPGEGEHKIMRYIRLQRAAPGYDPNTRHCLYGMDADLIMLGLATHDPHFLILRETITDFAQPQQRCFLCGQVGHRANECSGILEEEKAKSKAAADDAAAAKPPEVHEALGLMEKPFQFLLLNVLREYLAHDLFVKDLPFAWNLEKAIDDFVFLCFFVGNDFLPHLPLLEIREGAIERLCAIWKRLLPSLGGYVSEEGGRLNLSRVDVLLSDLGQVEDSIFKQRKSKEDFLKNRDKQRSAQLSSRRAQTLAAREKAYEFATETVGLSAVKGGVNTHSARALQPHIKANMMKQENITPEINNDASATPSSGHKRKAEASPDADDTTEADTKAARKAAKAEKKQSKKVKLESGAAAAVAVKKEAEEEVDSDADPADPNFKPHNDSSSSSSSSSDSESDSDDDDGGAAKRKSKKRKLKQAAKREAERAKKRQATEDSKAAAASVDNLALVSTSSAASALDTEAAKLDFSALLNAKLQKINRPYDDVEEDPDNPRDPVRFGEDGWKERYYSSKLHIDRTKKDDAVVFHHLFKSYAEGLAWVMQYYYSGCASWGWSYQYHYAPMASDLCNLDRYKIDFELGAPFRPMGQLMAVLPSLSAHALPLACQELMVNPMSPIADFYPADFPLDLNGKRALWQAVALLPWIEEKRLLAELHKAEGTFTAEERERNSLGVDFIFVHKSHGLANSIMSLALAHPPEDLASKTALECVALKKMPIDQLESEGMAGFISPCVPLGELGGSLESEVGAGTIEEIECLSAIFSDPPERPHKCELLPGLIPPHPVLDEHDFDESARGGSAAHSHQGNNSRNNRQRDAARGPGGGGGNGGQQGQFHTHGGQASAPAPRFGEAPQHFLKGNVGDRIWSSGFNQRGGGQQQGGRGGYAGQQQQQYGGYQGQQQQQQQQSFSHRGGYAGRGGFSQQPQRGGYGGGPAAYQQHFPPPPPPPQQQQAPAGFSHARSRPNQFAALQQQVQAAMHNHYQHQQQQRRPQ